MTRINVGIHPKNLTDEHLLAEHREIKRLPDNYRKAVSCGSISRIPNKFTLGTGHVMFFLDKFMYTSFRYIKIHRECLNRNFKVTDYLANFTSAAKSGEIDQIHLSFWNETPEARSLIIDRISERIVNSSKNYFHYYGKRISKCEAISLLKQDV